MWVRGERGGGTRGRGKEEGGREQPCNLEIFLCPQSIEDLQILCKAEAHVLGTLDISDVSRYESQSYWWHIQLQL